MSNFVDKIIEDLVKGASRAEGFMRGGRASVFVNRDGREEKLAMFGGAGGLMAPAAAAASMLSGGGAAVRPKGPATPPPLPQAALDRMHASSPFAAGPKLGQSYDAGVKAAFAAFGVKEGFAQFLPMLARAGAALAPKLLPAAKSVGNFAMTHPIGQQMAATAGSNLVNRAMTPQQPQ